MRRGLRLVTLVGAFCLAGSVGAEPVTDTQGSTPSITASSPAAAQQDARCSAPTHQASDACDGVTAVMMNYQKVVNKDAREDRRTQANDRLHALDAKAVNLKVDSEAIDQQMKESRERADATSPPPDRPVIDGPVAGIATAKPTAAKAIASDPCQPSDANCPEPCKLPPCK